MSEISVLEIILKGMAIGFLAAAPTGPSGVLVIQRTLNKGRWKGFLTGLGVSISDAVYIMITMMCLSLVLGYLENPTIALAVKLLGCALLFAAVLLSQLGNQKGRGKQLFVIFLLFTRKRPHSELTDTPFAFSINSFLVKKHRLMSQGKKAA